MDGFGHDVAQKIKSAIKAKLIELDAYVDDELPDYIMVMVANKKSKANMTEDLNLFLSDNTETFTNWLHEVLDKLQSVSLGTNSEGSKTRNKSSKSIKKEPEDKVEGYTEAVSTTEKMNIAPPVATVQPNASATGDSQDDVLAIDAEQEVDDIFADEIKEVEEPTKPSPVQIIVPQTTTPSTINTGYKPQIVTRPHITRNRILTPKVEEEKSDLNANQQPLNLTTSSRANGTTPSPNVILVQARSFSPIEVSSRKRKAPSSMVGAVLQRQFPKEDEEEDEYDPRHPTIGSVASVVQVTQRRSSVPPERQANRALLLKAVNEAHKSVLSSSRVLTETSPASQPLFTKRYLSERRPPEQSNTNKVVTVRPRTVERRAVLMAPRLQLQEKQLVTRSTSPIPQEDVIESVETVSYEEISIENEDGEQAFIYSPGQTEDENEMHQIESPPNPTSPKFIITLDGVDAEDMFSASYSNLDESETERTVHMDETTEIPANDDYDLELQSECESLYSGGVDNDTEATNTKGEEENATSTDNSMEVLSGKRLKLTERCRFWPSCRNGAGCPYQHPTVSCKAFPNCKFGLHCLYVHPNCKFDSACTRRECPFTHTSKNVSTEPNNHQTQLPQEVTPISVTTPIAIRNSSHVQIIPSSLQPSHKVQCRNFPNCNNVDCTFLHPKPCRYGISCTRSDCIFSHPPLPNRNQLRWSSRPSPELTQHIRSFDFTI